MSHFTSRFSFFFSIYCLCWPLIFHIFTFLKTINIIYFPTIRMIFFFPFFFYCLLLLYSHSSPLSPFSLRPYRSLLFSPILPSSPLSPFLPLPSLPLSPLLPVFLSLPSFLSLYSFYFSPSLLSLPFLSLHSFVPSSPFIL